MPERAAVPIKPAATVMLVRAAEHEGEPLPGIQVFMLRRTLGAAFAQGMYVFPGGRVEQSDGEDVDHAHRVAAIRECFEEAGVLLALDADGRHVADGHPALDARAGVYDGSIDLADLCRVHGLVLAVDELAFVSHWITPAGETTRRFDTRFYVAPAPPEQAHTHDDNETIESVWIGAAEALAQGESGAMSLMHPTVENLRFLAQYSSVEELMRAAHAMPEPPVILPKIRMDASGKYVGVAMPGDADYDALG